MEPTTFSQEPKKSNNKIYFLLLVVLALFTTNTILYIRNQKSNEQVLQLSDDKTRMQTEIDKIEAELDKANNDYAVLSEDMQKQQEEARQKISELREALRKGEITQKQLVLAQEDVKQLRYFVNKYVADIEELKQQNASLTNQRDSLQNTVSSVNERAQSLERKNKDLDRKVKAAAALKAAAITVTAVRIKSSGKESVVSKADNARKLNINFKLVSNEFAEKGVHACYVRVLSPSGAVLGATGSGALLANGDVLDFTLKTAIEFANDSRGYSIGWVNPSAFEKGSYTVMVYADGFVLGTGKVALK